MNTTQKYYLNVPFEEKDEAKELGACFDWENKKWYYKNEEEKYLFKKWLIKEKNTHLTEEQESLISLAKLGKNVLVDACIGSGKTTTIQELCNALPNKKILYLTYNTLLKIDAQEKISNGNVFVTNYHGFAHKCLQDAHIPSGVSDLIQNFLNHREQIHIPNYDLLVLDEYQDIELEIAIMLQRIKQANSGIQIIAVGDMEQKIYDKTTLNVPKFIDSFLENYERITFTKCFRLSNDLASTLGDIWGKKIKGVNKECKVREMNSYQIVQFLAKQNPEDILCLGQREGSMPKILNKLEEKYPDRFNKKTVYASIKEEDRGEIRPGKDTAIFTTFDSSKGLERKICIIFDFSLKYWYSRLSKPDTKYDIVRNIFCVAASRGKEEIIFVTPPDGKLLTKDILKKKVSLEGGYSEPFHISDMFSFKYKEDVEECFSLLKIKPIEMEDKTIIEVSNKDELIDISPCIGILQEVAFFKNYNIDDEINYIIRSHKDRFLPPLKKNANLEEKILYTVAYNTGYDRYMNQVEVPFISEENLHKIKQRLSTIFSPKEKVQKDCNIKISKKGKNILDIEGRVDVLKDGIVHELKFVNELSHDHFLQCAAYIVALNIEKGILWNVRNNERYEITVPDKKAFINAVVKTITKGRIQKKDKKDKQKKKIKRMEDSFKISENPLDTNIKIGSRDKKKKEKSTSELEYA